MEPYTDKGNYNDKILSAQDKEKVNALKYQWDVASKAGDRAGMDAAHAGAEGIRKGYQYSGGADGSELIPFESNSDPARNSIAALSPQVDNVNKFQDAQQQAALNALKSAHDKNVIATDATAAKIPAMYQAARNQTAATSEQNRAGFNERAAASGLNSGTGGQADLAMGNQLTGNLSGINSQEANAKNDLETARLQMSTQYNNAIAQAIADGNVERAKMLYSEAVRVDQGLVAQSMAQADANNTYYQQQEAKRQEQQALQRADADNLAAYGDFSGYVKANIYTQEEADRMYQVWAVKNPLVAQALQGKANFSGGGGGGGKKPLPPDETSSDYGAFRYEANMNRTENGLVTVVQKAVVAGKITEAEAKKILAEAGIK